MKAKESRQCEKIRSFYVQACLSGLGDVVCAPAFISTAHSVGPNVCNNENCLGWLHDELTLETEETLGMSQQLIKDLLVQCKQKTVIFKLWIGPDVALAT